CACAAAKLILCETAAQRRRLMRSRPIDHGPRSDTCRTAHDGETGHGKTEASTPSRLVANHDVIVEGTARLPTWFAKNVRQVWDRLVRRSGRYRDTVRSETMNPSFNSSP